MSNQMVKGNTAVIIGAMYAGCDCFFGYPITPASEILHEASKYFPMVGRNFVQAESEEASINMIYGGAATGHRVMTASSGPGISLMQEGFTYLAGAELPAVIVDIMRAGPGLGNIGPEQGDYNQIVKGGGHGNYKNIVLAPNSVQEMCDLTIKAFELADKYKNPVVVLADGTLGQMAEPLKFPTEAIEPEIDDSWAVRGSKETMKNLVKKVCNNYKLPYFTFSPTFSTCPNHGYVAGEHFKCPDCGADCEVYSRIVGYIRPVSQWNKGKQTEFYNRTNFDVDTCGCN